MVIQADLEPRPLRADARRNRDRLLAAAREAFAEQGGDAALDEIARCAGVGIGTLYRHFPTRQDLMEAAFLDQAQELQAKAVELAADPDPFSALVTWLRAHMVAGARGRSLASTVMCAKHQQGSPINVACTQMAAAGAALLVRAQAAGQVRP
ncbi:MAG: TetR/AcrR family transcriptional regulator, partial [Actinomycetes bacterium]